MDFKKLDQLKGFMPKNEGLALTRWAEKFTCHGPALEIGTFGLKVFLYIATGTSANDQFVYTVDHHSIGVKSINRVRSILIRRFLTINWVELYSSFDARES